MPAELGSCDQATLPDHDARPGATGIARVEKIGASDHQDLGKILGEHYRTRAKRGFEHSKQYYHAMEPVTCSMGQWRTLAQRAAAATDLVCPHASNFLRGVSEGLGWDVFLNMLDFELFTLELQRGAALRARLAATGVEMSSSSSSSSDGGSDSGSESPGGEGADAVRDIVSCAATGNQVEHLKELLFQPENRSTATKPNELPGHCTGFAFASGAEVQNAIVAQTVDLPGCIYGYGDHDTVLHLSIEGQRVVVYDCDGRLCPIGLNSAGLGVCVFNYHQSPTSGFDEPVALSVQSILWELLLGNYTLASAMAFLQALPVPVMCGSALLLADKSGVVTVELSPCGSPKFGEIQHKVPVVRANHPIVEGFEDTFGGSEKSRRCSCRRQRGLSSEFRDRVTEAQLLGHGSDAAFDGTQGLILLSLARKVRNSGTLACVCCDLNRGELHVQFKERHRVEDPDLIERLAKENDVPLERMEKLLESGRIQADLSTPRLTTGLPAPHVTHWKTYKAAV